MIQRIQTIYLLIAAILLALPLFFPFFTASEAIAASPKFQDKTLDMGDIRGLSFIIGLSFGVVFGSIFLFKKRTLQMNAVLLGVGLNILFLALVGFGYFQEMNLIQGTKIQPGIALVSSILAIVLTLVARRAIKKDDELVKASDRLR